MQWSARAGRKILNTQMGAALLSALVLTAVNLTAYAVPFLMKGPLRFADCGLDGLWACLLYTSLDVVVDVDAQHLALVAEVVQHLINDELAFIVGVTGVDDALGLRQKRVDALHQVFLVLGRLLRPIVDLDGQDVYKRQARSPHRSRGRR